MVRFYKKFYFFRIRENYFFYSFEISDIFKLSTYLFVKKTQNKFGLNVRKKSFSVVNSLLKEENEIFNEFDSTTRSHIRRAEREGVTWKLTVDPVEFVDFYNAFALNKKISVTSERRLEEMKRNLTMTYATLDGKILSAHSYLTDKELGITMLYHSASLRFDDAFDSNTIGRSNKLLHFKDMIYFKEKGFTVYDFGGYAENTSDPSLVGINRFKLAFGGEIVPYVNYYSVGYLIFKWVAKRFRIV